MISPKDELLEKVRTLMDAAVLDEAALNQVVGQAHPADCADTLMSLRGKSFRRVLKNLDPALLGPVLLEYDEDSLEDIMVHVPDDRFKQALLPLHDDDAAWLIKHSAPGDDRQKINRWLDAFDVKRADSIRPLLAQKTDTAGEVMSPDFLSVPDTLTADEALTQLRQDQHTPQDDIADLYVTDQAGRWVGMISLRALLVADPQQKMASLARRDFRLAFEILILKMWRIGCSNTT